MSTSMFRAIKELCQMEDDKFFAEISVGIGHIVEVADRLDTAARRLSGSDSLGQTRGENQHPAQILGNIAAEEAAKVLILVDAVRCPRQRQHERSRLLGHFYDHLAKGIYADVCGFGAVGLEDIERYVEYDRLEYYLDGPNGVNWIFPNRIQARREDNLYVNYVREGDAEGDSQRYWTTPWTGTLIPYFTPPVVSIAEALHKVGAASPDGLAVIAEVWRPVNVLDVQPGMRVDKMERLNMRTLELLDRRGLLRDARSELRAQIRDHWPFPLWPLELHVKKVPIEDLREVQRRWTPEF